MKSSSPTLWVAIWLAILVPLSVDNIWSIDFGPYHLRFQYLVFAVWAIAWLVTSLLKDRSQWSRLRAHFAEPSTFFFAGMGIAGVAGAFQSVHPSRAIAFLVWATGTILVLPFLVKDLHFRLGSWVPRLFGTYLLVQSVLILLDAAVCMPTGGAWHLGRVMIYGEVGSSGALCRPHGWYQEPGYFCAFAAFAWMGLRAWVERDESAFWRIITGCTLGLSLAAMVATTSRMGWIAVAWILLWQVWEYRKKNRAHATASLLAIRRGVISGGVAVLLILGCLAVLKREALYHHFIEPSTVGSFSFRQWRLEAGWNVFRSNPWVGAGPGAAGAYYVSHLAETDRWLVGTGREIEYMRNDPLSLNLFTEVLSEWGAVGFVFFAIGLFGLLRTPSRGELFFRLVLVAIVYSATQTLARSDLWIALGVVMTLTNRPLRENS